MNSTLAHIQSNPKYRELKRRRNRLSWGLTIAMLVVYYGFISLVAFNKPFLAQPIYGVTTLGIPLGIGVILFTIAVTGLYVRRANGEFETMTRQILDEATR